MGTTTSSSAHKKETNTKQPPSPKAEEEVTTVKRPQQEIIIKCTLEEMVRSFFKDYMIIWHDPNLNIKKEHHEYFQQLKTLCEVFTFTEYQEALNFIRETKGICHVITSGTNGEALVKETENFPNLPNIYIFCQNKEDHASWAKNYPKVSCVETTIQDILSQIQENLLKWYKKNSSFKLNLPAFAPIFNDTDKTQMNHLHHFLKVIPKFKNRTQAKEDFLSLSKRIYSDSKNLKFIQEFEEDYTKYNMAQILKWYTMESFLYKVTNNCLRIATSDSIQYCRLLLKDIERAIKQQYQEKSKDFSGLLYRGAYLSEEEWRNLQANKNQEIEMHGFLSVSKVKNVALHFTQDDPDKKVFITIIVPKGPNEEEQGFAEVHQFSEYPQEKEILFNVRSRFTVLEAQDKRYSGDLKCRHLVLLYGAQGFRKFLSSQKRIQQVSIENFQCAHCHIEISEEKFFFTSIKNVETASYCSDCVVDSKENGPFLCIPTISAHSPLTIQGFSLTTPKVPFYGYACSICEKSQEQQYLTCTSCPNRTTWCYNCFKNTPITCLTSHQHQIIFEANNPFSFWFEKMSENELTHLEYQNDLTTKSQNMFRQANMYFERHQYEKAEKYYSFYLQQNESDSPDRSDIASCYNNLGRIYDKRGEYSKAIESHKKSLKIYKGLLGENHINIAIAYSSIGKIYDHQEEYKTALKYHQKALEISKSYDIHEEKDQEAVAVFYNNIGMVYNHLEEFSKALEFSMKSLEIGISTHGENHPTTAISYVNIGKIYENQGDFSKALEYYLKGLEIGKLAHGEVHPDVANDYASIGAVYDELGEYKKALEYHFRALEILIAIYGENHSQVGIMYNNIGLIYFNQEDNKKAKEYYLKALEIDRENQNRPSLALSYINIGSTHERESEYKQALEYYFKSLEIGKSAYGEKHSQVAASYFRIASVYEEQKEYKKAIQFHIKALEIRKSIYGENHHDVSASYSSLASVYKSKGEDKMALEYWLKCLEVEKVVYGEEHTETASSYYGIGKIYEKLGDHINTLKYYSKVYHIRKLILGENQAETMEVHNKILQLTSSNT